MTSEPVDKHFGVPLSEWISRIPNELDLDAVGLWQVVLDGRDSFDLSGVRLRDFVTRGVIALLRAGAVPVRPSPEKNVFWVRQSCYGSGIEEIASNVVEEWERSGIDPDQDGLWFALLDALQHSSTVRKLLIDSRFAK
jgi:hypothetical protein